MKRFVVIKDETIVAEGVEFLGGEVIVNFDGVTCHYPDVSTYEEVLEGKELAWVDGEHRKIDRLIHRDAITGQLVSKSYADANPSTTVSEHVDG
jgi:hypothetical protein